MEPFIHGPQPNTLLLSILLLRALVLVVNLGFKRRRAFAQRNSLARCFAILHIFSKGLDESRDPGQMADAALGGTQGTR